MNKKQFSLCKKLFGQIKHHQLLNESVLHNFFAFYQPLLIVKSNQSNCGLGYIGETKRNAEVRCNEHNNLTKSLEPSKHLRSNTNHYST